MTLMYVCMYIYHSDLCQPPSFWHGEEKSLFERNLQGLLATFLAFKKRPEIRYTASSELTKIMAHEMTVWMDDYVMNIMCCCWMDVDPCHFGTCTCGYDVSLYYDSDE